MKRTIKKHLKNVRGWRTDRKIIVIESDDWGQVRTPSAAVLQRLSEAGFLTDRCHYFQNDALASEEDLRSLFSLFSNFQDKNGRHPVITANMIMANPDFDRIRESKYQEYFYESFTETFRTYSEHNNTFATMQEGIRAGFFYPQFHGREHVQVRRWLRYVQNPESFARKAFDLGVYAVSSQVTPEKRRSFLAAYDMENPSEFEFVCNSIREGIDLFETIFGFKPRSTIAPNYHWNTAIEQVLSEQGIEFIQSGSVQYLPVGKDKQSRIVRHFTGQANQYGQIYTVRNCTFEPSADTGKDWIENCLRDIKIAFLWKKPAIIESHRVNYIGYINPDNRAKNLPLLEKLLNKIVKQWPDVEFMTSVQLGDLIAQELPVKVPVKGS